MEQECKNRHRGRYRRFRPGSEVLLPFFSQVKDYKLGDGNVILRAINGLAGSTIGVLHFLFRLL